MIYMTPNKLLEFKVINKPIKVIFLDIDGVLNTGNCTHHQWLKDKREHTYDYQNHWDPIAMGNLKLMLDQFNDLYIVISSTWKLAYKKSVLKDEAWEILIQNFKNINHNDRIIGCIPWLINGGREDEINFYRKHTKNNITKFAVIDDDIFDLNSFKDKELVKCTYIHGLTSELTETTLKILDYIIKDPVDGE